MSEPRKAWSQVEISDPRFESEHLRHLTFHSDALGRRGDVSVFVPPGGDLLSGLPLVLLLHGVFGSHWSWAYKGGAHQVAMAMIEAGTLRPLMIAMPSDGLWGQGSGYLPHGGSDYERWIVDEVPDCLRENLPGLSDTSPQFIAGLSMGGYGALRLGAKYPARFRGISAHSAYTHFEQIALFVDTPLAQYREIDEGEKDVYTWLARHREKIPPLRFDCGRDDHLLLETNRQLQHWCREQGIPHRYEEFPGGHDWRYWHARIKDTLHFFNSLLTNR